MREEPCCLFVLKQIILNSATMLLRSSRNITTSSSGNNFCVQSQQNSHGLELGSLHSMQRWTFSLHATILKMTTMVAHLASLQKSVAYFCNSVM